MFRIFRVSNVFLNVISTSSDKWSLNNSKIFLSRCKFLKHRKTHQNHHIRCFGGSGLCGSCSGLSFFLSRRRRRFLINSRRFYCNSMIRNCNLRRFAEKKTTGMRKIRRPATQKRLACEKDEVCCTKTIGMREIRRFATQNDWHVRNTKFAKPKRFACKKAINLT